MIESYVKTEEDDFKRDYFVSYGQIKYFMKRLFLLVCIAFAITGCGKEADCRTCTGTVTNTGEMGDFTVCFEDGVLTQTNNITEGVITSSNTLPESVAFLISIGLECDD